MQIKMNTKIYKADVDVMIGDKFVCTVRKCDINGLFGPVSMIDELVKQIYAVRSSLKRQKRFDLYWKTPAGEDVHIAIEPKNKNLR